MRFLANYIMRGPLQAILVTSVTALLGLVAPLLAPLSYLSGAALGLVTLRFGLNEAAKVMGGSAVATALLGTLLVGNPLPPLVYALLLWLPVVVVTYSLRRTVSLPRSLLLAALFGAMLVIGMHVAMTDPAAWWTRALQQALANATPEQQQVLQPVMGEAARLMTGIVAVAVVLGILVSLLLARWWQAQLYHPGGFRSEFHALRLGKVVALVTAALVVLSGLSWQGSALLGDLLPLLLLLLLLQGLAVVHAVVARSGASVGWLVAVYVMLALPVVMAQTALVLAVAGLVDNWMNFRTFFGSKDHES